MSESKSTRRVFKRKNQIRAMLRKQGYVTVPDVAKELGVSQPYFKSLIDDLIRNHDVEFIGHEPSKVGGPPRKQYALTQEYFDRLKYGRNHWKNVRSTKREDSVPLATTKLYPDEHATRTYTLSYVQKRKPWYRRAMDWLTGDSDLRTGA